MRICIKSKSANLKTEVYKLDIDKLKSLSNNLSNLKTKVDKLDIDELIPVSVDLSKLSNAAKNEVVKKTEYNTKIKIIENKIPDISNLANKTILNTKINKVKNEIPSITGLQIMIQKLEKKRKSKRNRKENYRSYSR